MGKYDTMTTDDFDRCLRLVLAELSLAEWLAIPGIYEVVKEEYNNQALEQWEAMQEYIPVAIVPLTRRRGWWQRGADIEEPFEEEETLIEEMAADAWQQWELGRDPLPPDVADIRGTIQEQPTRIFAFRREEAGPIEYWGIVQHTNW